MGRARRLFSILLLLGLAVGAAAADEVGLSFEGTFLQGALITAHTDPGASVMVGDRSVRVSPDGWFLIGIGRDETGPVRIDIVAPDGRHRSETVAVQTRDYPVQRIDGLPETKVTPLRSNSSMSRAKSARLRLRRSIL